MTIAVSLMADGAWGMIEDGRRLSFVQSMRCLQRDAEARTVLTRVLASDPAVAFFWECAPVQQDRPFAFVILPSPVLARRLTPQPEVFAAHISAGKGTPEVRQFSSLGGDAQLIAPTAAGPLHHYSHLANFVRMAPSEQIHALWVRVGTASLGWLNTQKQPLWLSTSGLGVSWLHVRLDCRPKYIVHPPYRHR